MISRSCCKKQIVRDTIMKYETYENGTACSETIRIGENAKRKKL